MCITYNYCWLTHKVRFYFYFYCLVYYFKVRFLTSHCSCYSEISVIYNCYRTIYNLYIFTVFTIMCIQLLEHSSVVLNVVQAKKAFFQCPKIVNVTNNNALVNINRFPKATDCWKCLLDSYTTFIAQFKRRHLIAP